MVSVEARLADGSSGGMIRFPAADTTASGRRGSCASNSKCSERTGLTVPMSMMQIGIVRMLMSNRLMPMPVRMWLGYRFIVFVLVVLVMHMAVIMRQNIVLVVVLMALGQMQQKTAAH